MDTSERLLKYVMEQQPGHDDYTISTMYSSRNGETYWNFWIHIDGRVEMFSSVSAVLVGVTKMFNDRKCKEILFRKF